MEALHRPLDVSQCHTMNAFLGERVDGSWAAFECCDVEPRQNGKGNSIEAREAAGLFVFGERLIIHTAHEFPTANEAFLRMVSLIESNRDLERQVMRIRFANGEQGIELKSGARLKYRARTGGAGRGFAGADLVVLDEAYALLVEHVAAILPTLSTAKNPQVLFASSGGLARSTLLWALRKRALAGDAGRLAYVEHTAENVTLNERGLVESIPIDVSDRHLWAMANPALGSRISWEYVEAEFAAMPAEQFARERLGVFDPEPQEGGDAKLPAGLWAETAKPGVAPSGRLVFAFDVDLDGEHASIGVASGSLAEPVVELVEFRNHVGWLPARLVELVKAHDPLKVGFNAAGATSGQVGAITVAFREAGLSTDLLIPLGTGDYLAACSGFFSDVVEGRLGRPVGQVPLDVAGADASERRLVEGWVWNRRLSKVPISPLVAVTVARQLLPNAPKEPVKPVFMF